MRAAAAEDHHVAHRHHCRSTSSFAPPMVHHIQIHGGWTMKTVRQRIREQANSTVEGSLASQFRARLAVKFNDLIVTPLTRTDAFRDGEPITIIDLGGTARYWEAHQKVFGPVFPRLEITVINHQEWELEASD